MAVRTPRCGGVELRGHRKEKRSTEIALRSHWQKGKEKRKAGNARVVGRSTTKVRRL